jgi:hypothetical protein
MPVKNPANARNQIYLQKTEPARSFLPTSEKLGIGSWSEYSGVRLKYYEIEEVFRLG